MSWSFEAAVFSWDGDQPGSWRFARLPLDVADDLRIGPLGGWGSVRVSATIGASTWTTSVFAEKKTGSFLLPIKKTVRQAEGIDDGDVVAIVLRRA